MKQALELLATATFCGMFLVATGFAQGLGSGQGLGRGQGAGLEAKRADCRTQANRMGLVGPVKRADRQAFMQKCVHGAN